MRSFKGFKSFKSFKGFKGDFSRKLLTLKTAHQVRLKLLKLFQQC